MMPPHEAQNRKERLAAKAKQRRVSVETEPRALLRQLINRQKIYDKLKTHGPFDLDYLAIFLQTGEETEYVLADRKPVTLIYDENSEIKPSTYHLCAYTEPFSPCVRRTEILVLHPIINVQSQINQLMLRLRTATITREKA